MTKPQDFMPKYYVENKRPRQEKQSVDDMKKILQTIAGINGGKNG